MTSRFIGAFALIFMFGAVTAQAEEFYCEVLAVEGTVMMTRASEAPKALQEGDLLQVEDAIETASGATVDIAYDKDWSNVSRVEESSKIVIKEIQPTSVELTEGGVYAKLKALPKDSTFEVKTPTAIASVRGTEYRTTVVGGETEIFNLSDSDVFVYGFDDAGSRQAEPVVLANSQKTQVVHRGRPPVAPRAMEQRDFQPAERMRQGVERKIQENVARGRVGKIQDVKTIERFHEQRRAEGRGGAMRSDEAGRNVSGKREPLQAISGADARDRVKHMTGSEGETKPPAEAGFDQGRSVFAGEKKEENFDGRGLGQPYFPSDERARSGGPEPAGFPSERWKSGYEGQQKGEGPGHNFEANRERHEGRPAGAQMGEPRQQRRPEGQQGGNKGGGNKGGGNKGQGGQNRGGAKPGPRH